MLLGDTWHATCSSMHHTDMSHVGCPLVTRGRCAPFSKTQSRLSTRWARPSRMPLSRQLSRHLATGATMGVTTQTWPATARASRTRCRRTRACKAATMSTHHASERHTYRVPQHTDGERCAGAMACARRHMRCAWSGHLWRLGCPLLWPVGPCVGREWRTLSQGMRNQITLSGRGVDHSETKKPSDFSPFYFGHRTPQPHAKKSSVYACKM